jgi:demethylmenaquinone methyltransferase/2-methoxy-6-polyprenyl-1,4-benzoquinol methylase
LAIQIGLLTGFSVPLHPKPQYLQESVMPKALDSQHLRDVYDDAASRYDWQHGVLTAFSDQRGRRRLVQEAVRPGDRVLDAGGGTGSTALLAAKAAGVDGHVTLVDVSIGMLGKASERTKAAGLEERILCMEGDIYQLPFADETFDAVLSIYSLCPVLRPDRAALALYRLVRPGGRLGVAHSADPRAPWLRGLA